MFHGIKKPLEWASWRPVFGAGLLVACSSVQAGLLDMVADGIGSLKDKVATGASTSASPTTLCAAESREYCALANNEAIVVVKMAKHGGTCQMPDLNPDQGVDALLKYKSRAQGNLDGWTEIEAKKEYPDKTSLISAGKAFWQCQIGAINDAITVAKGPDPATFKPVTPTVKVDNLEALPKTRKVILSNFVVEFQKQYEKRKTGFSIMGMGNAGSSTAVMDATLPDQDTLQAITNFAYLDTVKKLRAKGYQVIEVTQLSGKSKASYENLTKANPIKSGEVFDNIDGQSVLVSPEGLTSTIPNAGCTHFGSRKAGANLANNMRQMSSGVQTKLENEVANAEGKIPLLKVWIAVEFGEVEANGGNAFISSRQRDFVGTTKTTVSNSANAQATQGMFLEPGVTHFSFELPVDGEKYNHGCGISFSKSTVTPPADGDVFIRLAEKYRDDGDSAPLKMSGQAGTVGVTDTYLGGGIGVRRVKDSDKGAQAQTFDDGKGTRVTQHGARTSGTVDVSGMGTSLHTTREWTAEIRSDVYAASAATMIYKVTDAFVGKLP